LIVRPIVNLYDEVSQSPWRVAWRPNLRGAGVLLAPGP